MRKRLIFTVFILIVEAAFCSMGDFFVEEADAISNFYIRDNASGGSCLVLGNWNNVTKTCTLTADINYGKILIESDGVTLDGGNHVMNGDGTGGNNDGVQLNSRRGVTIKNLRSNNYRYAVNFNNSHNNTVTNITSWSNEASGISLSYATGNKILHNNISNNNSDTGICIGYESTDNEIHGNTVVGSDRGIYLHTYCDGNDITENTVTTDLEAITLADSDSMNTIVNNTVTSNTSAIFLDYLSNANIIRGNTIASNVRGFALANGASFNQIYNNNFIDNISFQANASGGTDNVYNLSTPTGGNYWSDFDTPAEGCNDVNIDGFCDAPYTFSGGQDNLPLVSRNGWICATPSLSLQMPGPAYWVDFDDYTNDKLSINWFIRNDGSSVAKNVQLIANYHSNDVSTITPLPLSLGNIAANGGMAKATVKTQLPHGTPSFRSWVFVKAEDTCSALHYYPGQPPQQPPI